MLIDKKYYPYILQVTASLRKNLKHLCIILQKFKTVIFELIFRFLKPFPAKQ